MSGLTAEQRKNLKDGDFAVPGKRELPMHDERHVRLAWDMVDGTQGLTPAERKDARVRILHRAKELGVDTKEWGAGAKGADFGEVKPFEIFRAGRHTAMSGHELDFTEADLAASAHAYDPKLHEAPLVVGHPKTDDPAYGWVRSLKNEDGSLFAEPDQVDSAFAELVKSGRFKKISASFYTPTSPQNPAPGVYYLRHVGFLGAQPPALKGLKPVAFSEREEGVVEFHEGDGRISASLWNRLREFFIRKHGQDEADRVIPRDIISALEDDARSNEDGRGGGAAFYEAHARRREEEMTAAELAAKEADLKNREAAFAERERAIKEHEKSVRHDANVAFCEGLVKDGRMIAANKSAAVALLDYAAAIREPGVVSFVEGTETKTMAPADAVKALLSNQPKIVSYGQRITAQDDPGDTKDKQRDAEIEKFMEQHKGASYRDAMIEVSRKLPHLFDL
jgi:hypothetical protein